MNKAFTLIELLVVVLIIGILSAIALPQYTKAVEKSRLTEAITFVGQLRKAIDVYVMQNGYNRIEFIGKVGTKSSLDIDYEAVLSCEDGKDYCASKYFEYDAFCYAESECRIVATRKNGTTKLYTLRAHKYGNNGWSGLYCFDEKTDLGNAICKSLQTSGQWIHRENQNS